MHTNDFDWNLFNQAEMVTFGYDFYILLFLFSTRYSHLTSFFTFSSMLNDKFFLFFSLSLTSFASF